MITYACMCMYMWKPEKTSISPLSWLVSLTEHEVWPFSYINQKVPQRLGHSMPNITEFTGTHPWLDNAFLKGEYFIIFKCICVLGYVHMSIFALAGQNRASGPVRLQLQRAKSCCLTWTKLRSFTKTVHPSNLWDSSLRSHYGCFCFVFYVVSGQ